MAVARRSGHIFNLGLELENSGRRAAPAQHVVGDYDGSGRIGAFLPAREMHALGVGTARPIGSVIGA